MLLEVAKESQREEENQEGKKQWKGRGGGEMPSFASSA